MTEIEAIEKIKEVVSSKLEGFEIKIIQREFIGRAKYIAKIGLICKEGLINIDVINALVDFTINGENDDMALETTQIDTKELSYDILILRAEINIK